MLKKFLLIFMLLLSPIISLSECNTCTLNNVIGSPFTSNVKFPIALVFSPNCLAVANQSNLLNVDFFSSNSNCSLTPVGSPITFGGRLPVGISISPNGCLGVLTTSGINPAAISTYSLNSTCNATFVNSINLTNSSTVALAFSPDGNCLSVISPSDLLGVANITQFLVNSCSLIQVSRFNFTPSSQQPRALAYSPVICTDGSYLLAVAIQNTNLLELFKVDPATCLLSFQASVITPPGPRGLAFSPNGSCLVSTNSGAGNISVFPVNSDCTLGTRVDYSTSSNPFAAAFSPDGNCLAVVDPTSNVILIYSVDPSTCILTQIPGSPISIGNGSPVAVAFSPDSNCLIVTIQPSGTELSALNVYTRTLSAPNVTASSVNCSGVVTITGTANPSNIITVFEGLAQVGGPVIVSNDGTFSLVISNLTSGNHTLTVRSTNPANSDCFADTTINITVTQPVMVTVVPQFQNLCTGNTIKITANPSGESGPFSFVWTGPLDFNANTQTIIIPNATKYNSGSYTVTVTDSNNCQASATASVFVCTKKAPNVSVVPTTETVSVGKKANFQTKVDGQAPFNFLWTGPNGFNSTSKNINFTATLTSAGTYTVIVTDDNGCSSTASAELNVTP